MSGALVVLLALALAVGARAARLPRQERAFLTLRGLLSRRVRDRLGGFQQQVNRVDPGLPLVLQSPRRVAVIGGGLAGLSAAANLAERGFQVTLLERGPYLGGKIGAWTDVDEHGAPIEVEHGFHAFFRHYYNLNQFLLRTGISQHLVAIDDYLILERGGRRWGFRDVETSPVLNLLALRAAGLYRMRDILLTPARDHMDIFLRYDRERTFAALDRLSFRAFCEMTRLPARLRLLFTTFARAFFADEDRLSMAELVKSFHFYYLSHDQGLLYQYPAGDYRRTVIEPIQRHLTRHGVSIALSAPIDRIDLRPGGGFHIAGQAYDYAVLATDVVGARALAERSPDLAAAAPALCQRLQALRPSQRYAVLRVYTDRDARADIPVFVSTERESVLDAVALMHRVADGPRAFAAAHGGGVFELHCYAVPDDITSEAEIRARLLSEFVSHFPEVEGLRVLRQHLQVRGDFTAFHTGMAAERPGLDTGIPGLCLAGDWVALPVPAMLMEAAYTSGLMSANLLLRREGLQEHPVYSVPLRGVLPAK